MSHYTKTQYNKKNTTEHRILISILELKSKALVYKSNVFIAQHVNTPITAAYNFQSVVYFISKAKKTSFFLRIHWKEINSFE